MDASMSLWCGISSSVRRLENRAFVVALLSGMLLAACSVSKRDYDDGTTPDRGGGAGGDAGATGSQSGGRTGEGGAGSKDDSADCTAGLRDCDGNTPRRCDDQGRWQEEESCPEVCDAGVCRERVWSAVGVPSATPVGLGSVSLACEGASPYVAFVSSEESTVWGKLHVRRLEGGDWVPVGEPGFAEGLAPSLAFSGGVPHVAFEDEKNDSKLTLMRHDGAAWVSVGPPGFSSDQGRAPALAFSGTMPYVAYRDSASNPYNPPLVVVRYDGETWAKVGELGEVAYRHEIALVDQTPYVVFDGSLANSYMMSYTGSSWSYVGAGGLDDAGSSSLAFLGATPYVAFQQTGEGAGGVSVRMYNGSAWVNVGSEQFSDGIGSEPSIQLGDAFPYVAFRDDANDSKLTVMSFNGSAWVNVGGSAGVSEKRADRPQLAICSGTLYVAFTSGGGVDHELTVMKFD